MSKISISTAAINVVIQPFHNTQRYIDLFKKAAELEHVVKIRGHQLGQISPMLPAGIFLSEFGEESPVFGGVVNFFTQIETDADWYSSTTKQPVKAPDSIENIKSLFSTLFPNNRTIRFFLFPRYHILIFDIKSDNKTLSPNLIGKFFQILFSNNALLNDFGTITTTVIPAKENVSEIFKMSRISSIEYFIQRPNPDWQDSDWDARISKRMKRNGFIEEHYKAKRDKDGEGIALPPALGKTIWTASRNGFVKVRGWISGQSKKLINTALHPQIYSRLYDEKIENIDPFDVFIFHCKRMINDYLSLVKETSETIFPMESFVDPDDHEQESLNENKNDDQNPV